MKRSDAGTTLVELIVVLLIFLVVLGLVTRSFNSVVSQSTRLARSEESNIAGVVGLELLRHDLNQLGFGLPTEPVTVGWIGEASQGVSASAQLNDPVNGPPRPVAALERSGSGCLSAATSRPDDQDYTLVPCSDYLSLKATNLGLSPAAKRWTYLIGATPNSWSTASDNPAAGDSVVILGSSLSLGAPSVTLVPSAGGSFYQQFNSAGFANLSGQSYSLAGVYGVGTGSLRMPFNRVDYFVAKPLAASQMSAACAPGTGVLYRAAVNQSDGRLTYQPLLDCVASMQVVFGWDTDGTGARTWTNADGSTALGLSSDLTQALLPGANASASGSQPNIRHNLKLIKVYLLAQNGVLDPSYTSPSRIQVGMQPGENDASEGSFSTNSITYSYDIVAAGWQHYRWKVYRITVIPKNLPANQ